MARLTCPSCNADVSAAEAASGWCDACGKKIPASYLAAASTPQRTARDALMTDGSTMATRGRKRIVGTMIGALIGALVFAVLLVGPFRETGYILTFLVGFSIFLAAVSLGQIADGMLAK